MRTLIFLAFAAVPALASALSAPSSRTAPAGVTIQGVVR